MRDEKSGKTRIKFLFGIAVIVAAVYISFKYLIVYVWPFVIGVFIAVILEKKVIYLSDKLYIGLDKLLGWNKRITIKKKKCQGIAATIIVSLIFVVLLALFSFIIFKGVDEFSRLLRNLDYNLIAVKQLTARMCFDGAPGETGFRVQPLDKTCRELNRKYVMPLGYALNNLLITNWDNQNYTELDFYDLYEKMYYMKYGKQVPYEANYGGVEYEVPEDEFEEVIKTYLPFSNTEIEKGTFYNSDNKTFRYRPRGLYDCEFPYEPYPEVISYEKLQDGTLKLTIEAVWEIRMLDQAITSELMIKPMEDGSFQYLSNKVIKSDQNANAGWYMPRLTEEEWEENYSNN